MIINTIKSTNATPVNFASQPKKCEIADGSAFTLGKAQEQASTKVKAGVLLTTLTSIAMAMAFVFKHKGEPFNSPLKFFKTLTHIKYEKEKHEVEKLVATLGLASIAGGVLGGLIFDKKENYQAKYRESLMQLCNVFTPLGFVAGAIHLFEKAQKKYPSILVKDTPKTKTLEILLTGICLTGGILAGNKIGNVLNKSIFGEKDKRKIKMCDMSPHIDDLCLAASLMTKDVPFVPRLIPAALIITGYAAGISQETNKNKEIERQKAQFTKKI